MAKIVPLISSGTAGPLGVLHLPRLWLKVSLEARGKLADGYPAIGQGFDMMVCNALGLEPNAVKQFIAASKPNYVQFEDWVRKNAKHLDKATVYKLNMAIQGYIHDEETRTCILKSNNVADASTVCPDAVNLNNLDDWYGFHQAELR